MTLKVISLGAGVQSSALLLMAQEGMFGDIPDYAIFADTQWEPKSVYEHLSYLESISKIPIRRCTLGSLRDASLDAERKFASMPLVTTNQAGKVGRLRRQCTHQYKIRPLYHDLRRVLGLGARERPAPGSVELWMGISMDEAHRMKPAQVQWVVHRWPLIEQRISRADCLAWLDQHGYPEPPKSACMGCPYHDDAMWRTMKMEDPESFADAVDFDERVRNNTRIKDAEVFVYRKAKPLKDVDFRTEEDVGQINLFDQECEGMCGV